VAREAALQVQMCDAIRAAEAEAQRQVEDSYQEASFAGEWWFCVYVWWCWRMRGFPEQGAAKRTACSMTHAVACSSQCSGACSGCQAPALCWPLQACS
jgi:hypothetical protein